MRRALQALAASRTLLAEQFTLPGLCELSSQCLGGAQGAGRLPPYALARLLSSQTAGTSSAHHQAGRTSSSSSSGGVKRQPGQQRQRNHRQQRSDLFIPPSWKSGQQHPLAQQLLALLEAGDAQGAHTAFHAALSPLLATVEQGEAPAPDTVPPPNAWKLYFTALSALRASAHQFCHALDLMRSLGVAPQPACYVLALRQVARQGLGHVAVTKVRQMEDAGLPPTLRCYLSAVEACLRSSPPEHGWARKLLDEVSDKGLAQHPSQRTDTGKLLMQAVREFARHRRFAGALALLDQLEALGLRVPAILLAEVTHLATLAQAEAEMLECVRRLEAATQTFNEVEGASVTRPLKVEEGLCLGVLEVAAGRGNVELAEAAWRLLERSVALPNPPSNAAAADLRVRHAAAPGGQHELAAAAGDEQLEQQQAGAAPAGTAPQQPLLDELEALDAAAATQTLRAGQHQRLGEVAPRGMRPPSVLSHLALIHAYAAAGRAEPMLRAVGRLVEAHPAERATAAAYHSGLPMCVDALAASGAEGCDAALHTLRDWAQQGQPVLVEQLNVLVAACCQTGDLRRAFEAFDSFGAMGAEPDADTYAALMQGCIGSGQVETALQVHEQQEAAGVAPTAWTHHQLVDARVVSGDVPAMLAALEDMQAAGHTPRPALLDRCLARAERAGDRKAVQQLLELMLSHNHRPALVDAQARRWAPAGGMRTLTGSSQYVSRDELLRQMRGQRHPRGDRRQQRGATAG